MSCWPVAARALFSSGCCGKACMELRVAVERAARYLCVHDDDGEGTGSKERKGIVVIMKFARKQRKHIYPLPVVYQPSSPFIFF